MSAKIVLYVVLASCVAVLAGCGGIEQRHHPAYAPMEPIAYPDAPEGDTAGSLYSNQRGLSLFADTRARSVGDIINVVLVESTRAAKSADTDVSRSADVGVAAPVLFGQPFNFGGGDAYDLSQSVEASSGFQGSGSSNQSNSLSGAIAVQVARVLPNGNLQIQGEKWLALNQGEEYIQLRGIVRPQDISPTNAIPSTLVADARISYGGVGIVGDANEPGWLTRFFNSPINPF